MVKNKRLYSPTLIILYTRERGCACAGAQAKENMMFSINKALHSDFPKPAEDLQRIFMQYIHAVIAEKRDPNCKTISPQLEKYFFTVKYNLLANKYTEAFLPLFSGYFCCLFLIVLRDNETSCQTKIRKAKTCLVY